MATEAFLVGVVRDENGESQQLIPCGVNKLLRSTDSETLAAFDTDPASTSLVQSIVTSGSPVSVSNGTPKTITSIDLTEGTWDVEFLLGVQGVITGTSMSGSISTTNDANGTLGDNMVQVGLLNLSSAQTLVVPSYQIVVTTPITVYGVADVTLVLGTPTCFGKLRARKVA